MNRSLPAKIGVLALTPAAALLMVTGFGGGPGRALTAASLTSGYRPGTAARANSRPGGAHPVVTPEPTRSPGHKPKPHPGTHYSVGVAVASDVIPSADSFAKAASVHPAMVETYQPFGAPFPQHTAGEITGYGSTPFLQWDPVHAPLSQIAKGRYDSYLRQYAAAIKSFGHRIVLSFGHEMNGSWYSWGRLDATPAQFVAAWRLIHGIFARSGVRNVTWSWDPSHCPPNPQPWWPGAAYVDRIGIDGYQRYGETFGSIFSRQLANIRRFTSKPVFIAETSVQRSSEVTRQIMGLCYGIRDNHLGGFVWFDMNRKEIWRLEGRPAAIRAFRDCVALLRKWS